MWLLFWLSEEFNPFCVVSIDLPCSINLNKLKSNLKTAILHFQNSSIVFQNGQWWKLTLQSSLPLEVLCTVLIVIPMGRILDIHIPGYKRDVFRVAEGARQCHWEGAVYYLGKVMVIGSLLEERKFHTCCQEGKEEGSYRLVARHPLGTGKIMEQNLGSHFQAYEEWEGK